VPFFVTNIAVWTSLCLFGVLNISTIIPFLLHYVDNRRPTLVGLIDAGTQSPLRVKILVSPELPIEDQLEESGFGGLRGELNGILCGCRESGEGAPSCDPEYIHVWRERLFAKDVNKMALAEGVHCLDLHRMNRKGHWTLQRRQRFLKLALSSLVLM
jgi:hypothetical protein